MSGLMKLLASMGMPIPRFADSGVVKGSRHNFTVSNAMEVLYVLSLASHSPSP